MSTPLAELLDGQHTFLSEETAERWRSQGFWADRSLRAMLTDAAKTHPERVALVGHRRQGPRVAVNYRQFDDAAHHAAAVLDSLGVGVGDAVALMLPNWVEYPELIFGILEIGAVYSGIPVAYGDQQAAAILRRSKAKVLIIPRRFRSSDHLELSRRVRAEIPTLRHVVVLVDNDRFSTGLAEGESWWDDHDDVPAKVFADPNPGRLCTLGFTSGTTGEPKGAMHTHQTLGYAVRALGEHIGPSAFGEPLVQLVASPIGHLTGYTWGVLLTVHLAGTGVHIDHWDPQWGADVMRQEAVTCFVGAPTFLYDIVRSDLADDPDCPLQCLVVAGAPIPRNLPATAGQALGAYIAPAWGMTECTILSSCTPSAPNEIQSTDGSIFAGSDVRILAADGTDEPLGKIGELLIRGPGVVLGYYDRPDATDAAVVEGQWLRTGDTASIDEHGWLSIHGRTKDIVIRGGENIPVTEVESLLFEHPEVLNAAVVGIPDNRLGERICAMLVTRPGTQLSVDSLGAFLLARGLSKHFLPETIMRLDELPTTPTGKVQKFKLRELAAKTGTESETATT